MHLATPGSTGGVKTVRNDPAISYNVLVFTLRFCITYEVMFRVFSYLAQVLV